MSTQPQERPVHRDGAGILFKYTDEFGDWYLLTKRAHWLSFGGTWATPGGSIDDGETPLEAAARELEEELLVHRANVKGTTTCVVETRDEKRLYSTFVIELEEDNILVPQKLPSETADVAWFQPGEIEALNLHPSFRALWKVLES